MRLKNVLVAILVSFHSMLGSLLAGDVTTKVLTDLDRFEPFVAHGFHAGHLWVAKSREGLGAAYRLEVYLPSGQLVKTIPFEHSLRHLQPYGSNGVIVVGIGAKQNLSAYTIVTVKNGTFSVSYRQIPLTGYADEVAAGNGKVIFTDPGGMGDDDAPIGTPSRTFFRLVSGQPRYLSTRLRGPHQPVIVGGKMFAIEHASVFSGGGQLVEIDLNTEKVRRLVQGGDIAHVLPIQGGAKLVLSDRKAGEVSLFDTATGKVEKVFSLAGESPRASADFGKCLAVGSEMSKKVVLVHKTSGATVAVWDVSVVGEKLYGIRSIAADITSGKVWVRSAYPADPTAPGGTDRNSVVEVAGPGVDACKN